MKQLKQTEDVLSYLNALPDDFRFDDLLYEYNQSIIHFYHTWIIAFVKQYSQHLESFSDQIVPIHAAITNLTISKLQNRYLRLLFSLVSKYSNQDPMN